ncbi:MAG: hypothetical protein RLO51_17520 [Thalassobaculum sp.]|uniref:hypothetical protein n=1 Tax=Thalassobaculum sp. TaxID=2022740 RepID=UPI0032EC01C1
MPWGAVRIDGPPGRDVYINGNYGEPAGQTGGTFAVQYGSNCFETVDALFRVDLAADAVVNDARANVVAVLAPVFPPRPTPLTPNQAAPTDWL